ncbi:hypothetical protein PENSPDRAFT_670931 [Peniophora sp. CONT]|nr:hypothetical protein PENSPDRAFT_670931 [Peniophora sp. CONT]
MRSGSSSNNPAATAASGSAVRPRVNQLTLRASRMAGAGQPTDQIDAPLLRAEILKYLSGNKADAGDIALQRTKASYESLAAVCGLLSNSAMKLAWSLLQTEGKLALERNGEPGAQDVTVLRNLFILHKADARLPNTTKWDTAKVRSLVGMGWPHEQGVKDDFPVYELGPLQWWHALRTLRGAVLTRQTIQDASLDTLRALRSRNKASSGRTQPEASQGASSSRVRTEAGGEAGSRPARQAADATRQALRGAIVHDNPADVSYVPRARESGSAAPSVEDRDLSEAPSAAPPARAGKSKEVSPWLRPSRFSCVLTFQIWDLVEHRRKIMALPPGTEARECDIWECPAMHGLNEDKLTMFQCTGGRSTPGAAKPQLQVRIDCVNGFMRAGVMKYPSHYLDQEGRTLHGSMSGGIGRPPAYSPPAPAYTPSALPPGPTRSALTAPPTRLALTAPDAASAEPAPAASTSSPVGAFDEVAVADDAAPGARAEIDPVASAPSPSISRAPSTAPATTSSTHAPEISGPVAPSGAAQGRAPRQDQQRPLAKTGRQRPAQARQMNFATNNFDDSGSSSGHTASNRRSNGDAPPAAAVAAEGLLGAGIEAQSGSNAPAEGAPSAAHKRRREDDDEAPVGAVPDPSSLNEDQPAVRPPKKKRPAAPPRQSPATGNHQDEGVQPRKKVHPSKAPAAPHASQKEASPAVLSQEGSSTEDARRRSDGTTPTSAATSDGEARQPARSTKTAGSQDKGKGRATPVQGHQRSFATGLRFRSPLPGSRPVPRAGSPTEYRIRPTPVIPDADMRVEGPRMYPTSRITFPATSWTAAGSITPDPVNYLERTLRQDMRDMRDQQQDYLAGRFMMEHLRPALKERAPDPNSEALLRSILDNQRRMAADVSALTDATRAFSIGSTAPTASSSPVVAAPRATTPSAVASTDKASIAAPVADTPRPITETGMASLLKQMRTDITGDVSSMIRQETGPLSQRVDEMAANIASVKGDVAGVKGNMQGINERLLELEKQQPIIERMQALYIERVGLPVPATTLVLRPTSTSPQRNKAPTRASPSSRPSSSSYSLLPAAEAVTSPAPAAGTASSAPAVVSPVPEATSGAVQSRSATPRVRAPSSIVPVKDSVSQLDTVIRRDETLMNRVPASESGPPPARHTTPSTSQARVSAAAGSRPASSSTRVASRRQSRARSMSDAAVSEHAGEVSPMSTLTATTSAVPSQAPMAAPAGESDEEMEDAEAFKGAKRGIERVDEQAMSPPAKRSRSDGADDKGSDAHVEDEVSDADGEADAEGESDADGEADEDVAEDAETAPARTPKRHKKDYGPRTRHQPPRSAVREPGGI